MNKVIKQALHYEEKNWDKFSEEMLSLVKIQYQELEKCVVRSGEYRFRPQFAYMEVSLSTWNKMSVKQREQHMKTVYCASVQPTRSMPKASSSSEAGPSQYFNNTPAPAVIPKDTWDRCLLKVNTILDNPESMCTVPGGNKRSRYVASSRNPDSPIKVQAGKCEGKYSCIKAKCQMFAGYGICAHILAVAVHNGDNNTLLEKYSRATKGPSLMDVAMMGMPKDSGKKPYGKSRRKKRSKQRISSPQMPESLLPDKPEQQPQSTPCFQEQEHGVETAGVQCSPVIYSIITTCSASTYIFDNFPGDS